jgi:flagellar basal-body rod protein FlgG
MNLSLYSAATGMEAQQLNLNTIANNLANVNTPGFKRSKIEFQDLLYQKPTRAAGTDSGGGNIVPSGAEVGNGTRVAATSKVFTQGQLTNTGEDLDLAIQGDGFFEVQRPDGTVAYTRDGSFKLNAQGQVVTTDGLPVLSGFQSISAGSEVAIAENGQVTVTSSSGSTSFRLTLTRFANPTGLRSLGGNLYEETAASGTPEVGQPSENSYGSIMQGYTEGSNVNIVEEMVALIIAQRAYEINSKSIQTSDEMLQNVAQMKR